VSDMVRKQIYLHKRHQLLLDQLARARGVSQAEIIRRAIEREAAGEAPRPTPPDRAAWDMLLAAVAARKALGCAGTAYQWRREDAYQERERRSQQPRISDPG
jgi:hypothetical protein